MQTVLSYRSSKYGRRSVEARLVWAGHEPQEFINLFPDWQPHTEVAKINKEVRYFRVTSLFYMRQNWVPISLGLTLNISDLFKSKDQMYNVPKMWQ